MIVNRRQLLQALSVLTAGTASGGFPIASFAADPGAPASLRDAPLMAALTRSKENCESILENQASVIARCSSGPSGGLRELTALIDQANLQLVEQRHQGPAFWQACSDSFLRAAEQLGTLCSEDQRTVAMFEQAESLFRQTAQLLEIETRRTAKNQAR